ncbi:MAG: N-acetylmuramoyl-L-alanine amidase [Treponema sp.]|jgi:N-acetylmuramoyl-L-alanine amidase|nr:N-acetylmuramoyl-L-alanine amidase [Treponema sp.]
MRGCFSRAACAGAVLPVLIFLFGPSAALFGQAGGPGRTFSLEETLKSLGSSQEGEARLRWDPLFQGGVLTASGHNVAFQAGAAGEQGLVMIDNRDLLPVPAPYVEQGILRFPEAFVTTLRKALDASIQNDRSRFRIAAIIVDPGHGGRDAGAVGTHTIQGKQVRVVEKDITLKVSLDLHSRLSAAYPDKRVLLTRSGDTYPTLEDRVVIANSVPLKENEAIVFISIHANASFNKAARGYEVWYLSPDYRRTVIDRSKYADSAEVIPILNAMLEEEFTTESIMIAQSILKQFEETLGSSVPSRGIKAEEWFVVRNARMPSVLVELGFVTNEEDALLMTDGGYLQKFSEALYKGITDFVTIFERSGGFTTIQ